LSAEPSSDFRKEPARRTFVENPRKVASVPTMPTLQQQVADKFLARLSESGVLDSDQIDQLRTLLTGNKKIKADDLVKLFSQPAGNDVK
jgi:hypothetical protein